MISTKTSLSLTRVEWIAHVQMDYFHSGPTTGVPRRAFTRVSLTARSRGRKHPAAVDADPKGCPRRGVATPARRIDPGGHDVHAAQLGRQLHRVCGVDRRVQASILIGLRCAGALSNDVNPGFRTQ